MKKALLVTLVLMLVAGTGFAQNGFVGVFADNQGTNCNLAVAPGLFLVYVVHVFTAGSTAVQYSAPKPACLTATYLSDTNMFAVTIGHSQTGVAVGYGSCRIGTIHVQTLAYFVAGGTAQCCEYPVLPDPNVASGHIETVNCAYNLVYAMGITGIVNPNPTCVCDSGPPLPFRAVDVVCPPNMTVPAVSTIPSISLVGFRVTNAGATSCAFDYSVVAVGPSTLVDKGNPASLSGTTPVLASLASYYPPEAGLLVPQIRVYGKEYVTYRAEVAGDPSVTKSCTTVITFEAPVLTKLATWGQIKALFE